MKFASIDDQTCFVGYTANFESHVDDRASPSGKAPVFGTGIRGFESLRPSQTKSLFARIGFLFGLRDPKPRMSERSEYIRGFVQD